MPAPFLKIFPPLLGVLLLALHPLQAAPREVGPPPASPSVGKVLGSPLVVRGGVCEVIVRGIAMPGDLVEFKILKGPRHGSLEGPRPLGKDSVVYIYRHNGKKGADADRIDFKLKTGPNNTWGRLSATIAIEEPASRLELDSNQLDFGSVPIGQSRSAGLRVSNGGGGILRGTLETGEPWSLDGSRDFELVEGAARNFLVVFSPDGPGERQGRLDLLAGGERQPVTLRGEGTYRFNAPERIAFEPGVGKNLEIPLTNLTNRELPLSIVLPAPLVGESQATLPANGVAALRLGLEKRHYTEKFAEVSIADGLAVRKVQVALPPPPALLEWASEGGEVDLGEIPLRHIPRPEFELRNRGASAAIVRIREGGGGLALAKEQAEEFHLLPGESAVVKTVWRLSENPGEVTAGLIASHGGLDHALRLKAIVTLPPDQEKKIDALPEKSATPDPSPIPVRILSATEGGDLARRLPRDISYRLIPRGREVAVRVAWKYGGPEPVLFLLERKVFERSMSGLESAFERRLQVPQNLPKPEMIEKWVPVPSAEALIRRLEDGTWEGFVPGLAPGFHEVRISVRSPPDSPRIDQSAFVVKVMPLPPSSLWKWIAGAIGIFCLLYLLRNKILSFFSRGPRYE